MNFGQLKGGQKSQNLAEILFVKREPRNQRHPGDHVNMRVHQTGEVIQHPRHIHPQLLAGQRFIHDFQIEQHFVARLRQRKKTAKGAIARRFNRRSHSPFAQAAQKTRGKLGLHQHLAARQGDAAAGGAEEDLILQHLFKQIIQGDVAANLLPRAGGALDHVLLAAGTAQALALTAYGLNFRRDRFRIGAPRAGVRAAFKKHDGADPLTVIQRVALDVKNARLIGARFHHLTADARCGG